jgi:hypothetical protein
VRAALLRAAPPNPAALCSPALPCRHRRATNTTREAFHIALAFCLAYLDVAFKDVAGESPPGESEPCLLFVAGLDIFLVASNRGQCSAPRRCATAKKAKTKKKTETKKANTKPKKHRQERTLLESKWESESEPEFESEPESSDDDARLAKKPNTRAAAAARVG